MPSDPDTPVKRVGFIGLGDMGGAIATRIIKAGWPTILWARRPHALDGFDAPNVASAGTPAALAAEADLIGICVWADDDVREVITGTKGVLAGCREGTIVIIHSTILPATCRELAELAEANGVLLLDAPVTGGRKVALQGALTVGVGGDKGALARCQPVFDTFASTVVHLGAVGAGQVAKLLNNALLAANLAVADDALTLGEMLGVDKAVLAQFLRGGSGRSYALEVALASRASAATRETALAALEKDLVSLTTEAASTLWLGPVLRDAAAEAITRLRHPPGAWR